MIAKSGRWRVVRKALLAGSFLSGSALLMGFFIVERRPAWYQPAEVSPELIDRVRRETATAADDFGDRLVRGQTFEFLLNQDQLNDWLAAAPALAVDLESGWPEALRAPALRLEQGRMRIGSLAEASGWRVIAGAVLTADVVDHGESVAIRLNSASAGSMPIPHTIVRRLVAPLIHEIREKSGRPSGNSTPPDSDGATLYLPARYVWPNGERPFRIRQIMIDADAVRLSIQPE